MGLEFRWKNRGLPHQICESTANGNSFAPLHLYFINRIESCLIPRLPAEPSCPASLNAFLRKALKRI